jgi:hypothetical protein
MMLLQCPSCWADPRCADCSGVIALALFWIFAILAMAWAVGRDEKIKK